MGSSKTYRVFVPEDQLHRFEGHQGQVFTETVIDEDTQETFQAEILVSQSPEEGYDRLLIQGRGGFLSGDWYVKLVRREEEEAEPVTIFESMKLGDRRGHMLRSMMAEAAEKAKKKQEIMTTELEKRLERKRRLVDELLDKKEKE